MSRRPAGRRGPSAGDDRTGRVSDRFRVRRPGCRAGGHSGSLGRRGSLPGRPPAGPSDRDAAESESARPDRRRESEPVFIFAQSSQRPTRSQLSDLKARGRDESRRAAAGDWAGVRRAAETGWGSGRRTVSCRMLGVHGSKRDVLEVSAGVWHVSTDTCALDT